MASSHIFAMPTLADTFGFVYLEAMANGCAVIGPNTQPQSWILDDGIAGLMVKPTSVPALCEAIRSLVENPELRTRIALAGLKRFRSTFSAPVVAAQYHELFADALEAHKRWSEGSRRERLELTKAG